MTKAYCPKYKCQKMSVFSYHRFNMIPKVELTPYGPRKILSDACIHSINKIL